MTRYAAHVNTRKTAQGAPARSDQAKNNAGGYVFTVDKWKRLDRFLILGADSGTYYVGERELTRDNARVVVECLAEDGFRVVARIVEISDAGRAPKNDPAIFALAMAASYVGGSDGLGRSDNEHYVAIRRAALAALPKVCRIGTHLFHFAESVQGFRGWGKALVRAVGAWYTNRSADSLAFDLVKYQSRDGWSHRDLIKLSHPKAPTPKHKAALTWSARGGLQQLEASTRKKGGGERGVLAHPAELPVLISAFEQIHSLKVSRESKSFGVYANLIREYRLPHECVPNELKRHPEIWEALVGHMKPTALMRNLNKMTAVGLLKPMSSTMREVCAKLTDSTELFKARVHPLQVLIALRQYSAGHGDKGRLTWEPVREIVDALDEAFYKSFEAIEPTGARTLIALDVSGSMSNHTIAGMNITAREGAAAMAMATARTEKNWHAVGFTASGFYYGSGRSAHSDLKACVSELLISPRQRLDNVCKTVSRLPMGGTDCSLPMLYALDRKLDIDCFIVYTDNETWHGDIHPYQALRLYREKTGIAAKLVVVGMTATEFSIADQSDAGMLDVVGFDAAAPAIIADFTADRDLRPEDADFGSLEDAI